MKKRAVLAAMLTCALVPSAAHASAGGAASAVKREVQDNNAWQVALHVRCTKLTRTKYVCRFNLFDNEDASLHANRKAYVRQYGRHYDVTGNW